jgi:Flp pilus assembly pilin Flp
MAPNFESEEDTPMNRLNDFMKTFITDDSGVDLLEFAVAGGLIAASAVVAMKDLRGDIVNAAASIWTSVTSDF